MKKITLYDEPNDYSGAEGTRENVKTVWADKVKRIAMQTAFRAAAVDIDVSMQAVIWAHDYNEQQYAEIDGVQFVIKNLSPAESTRKYRLLMARR